MKQIVPKPLIFPIGDKEYTVPPVGWETGLELTALLTAPPERLAKMKQKPDALFKMALSLEVWEQMLTDRAPSHLQFRAGMAAVAHFQVLMAGGDAEAAQIAADGIWESGLRPEAVAAWMAARVTEAMNPANPESGTTSPASARAGSSTKRPANTSGTTSRTTTRASRKPSSGRRSPTVGR